MPDSRFAIIRLMRTTIDIPDVLYKSVKSRCATMGTTMRYVTIALYGNWMQQPATLPQVNTEYIFTDAPKKTDAKSRIPFLGIARRGANLNVSHDWKDIKKSIEDGWAEEAMAKERRIRAQ